MDGIEGRRGVLVVGCSNQPKLIDAALLRQGRLEHLLYLGPPTLNERQAILANKCRGMRLAPNVDLAGLAERTEMWSPAALEVLCREASLRSFREALWAAPVSQQHFDAVLESGVVPPISKAHIAEAYENFVKM